MTNNYLKITAKAARGIAEVLHLEPDAVSSGTSDRNHCSIQDHVQLAWFFPFDDTSPRALDAIRVRVEDLQSRCADEFKPGFRGCHVSVFRDFDGNEFPVVGNS